MQCVLKVRGNSYRWLRAGFVAVTLFAASSVMASSLSQGYQSNDQLTAGTLVSTGSDSRVSAADITNVEKLVGVVVNAGDSALSVTTAADTVQVATGGTTTAFVTDVSGAVKAGDAITASPIKGVGMKQLVAGRIVGVAQNDATYEADKTVSVNKGGKSVTARLGSVKLSIQPSYYAPPKETSAVPSFLQAFANAVAGKQVSVLRLVASFTILLAGFIAAGVVLFATVRSTIISIGRNPLARSSIYGGLWQVAGVALVILIVSVGSSYLVLVR